MKLSILTFIGNLGSLSFTSRMTTMSVVSDEAAGSPLSFAIKVN